MRCPLVIGLGSNHGDDQAGWLVIDRLRERSYPNDRLVRLSHPAGLLDALDWDSESPRQDVIICDACIGNGRSGAIHRLRWTKEGLTPLIADADEPAINTKFAQCTFDVPPFFRRSASHDVSIFDLMELGVNLGWSPASVVIWTLEGATWTPGTQPSAAIQSAANQIADQILKEFQHA